MDNFWDVAYTMRYRKPGFQDLKTPIPDIKTTLEWNNFFGEQKGLLRRHEHPKDLIFELFLLISSS